MLIGRFLKDELQTIELNNNDLAQNLSILNEEVQDNQSLLAFKENELVGNRDQLLQLVNEVKIQKKELISKESKRRILKRTIQNLIQDFKS